MNKKVYNKCQDLSVLLVEDYLPLQKKITLFLQNYFKKVEVASNGREGVEKYLDFKKKHGTSYDIVISDYEMPKMNGIEMIKEIKDDTNDQLFIVISAHQEPEYLIEFINLGILHYIPKPIEPHTILNVLDKVSDVIFAKM
ncbi:MAG: response regulator, partial [Campylobacterota bacterium]